MDNKELLADLLAQPGKVGPEHASMLQEMAEQFPYAQPIQLLLARANAAFVPKAALYGQGHVLFHILNMVPVKAADTVELDEQEVFDETGASEEAVNLNQNEAVEIETPDHLPGSDNQLVDLPAVDHSFIEAASAIDFFAFEEKTSTEVVAPAPEIETVVPDSHEKSFVSKYDDDELPYTFLWWLAKTRAEHEQISQPNAQAKPVKQKAKPQTAQPQEKAEFQQQYVEHIFHIQTPFEVADHLAEYPAPEVKDVKGAEIIERFLKEDPTIKPPKPELIDNENKAKKSAEDHYDLVSETLAKIYIEQMLYHKAIDTYKKLSLKYPEKSGYFADLIQSIEKKF